MDKGADLIAAISTATGPGAVAMIRLSGRGALDALGRFFKPNRSLVDNPRQLILGKVVSHLDGALLDHAMAAWFPGPSSFTGEDSVELQGHGGSLLPKLTLELALASGARLARPGEFTERAFLNGRLSLDQAEAVAEIVASESRAEARIAAKALDGALRGRVLPLFDSLKGSLAFLTGILDFEEDWTERNSNRVLEELGRLKEGMGELIELRKSGKPYREGLRVVLAGPPNAGKSALFNALLGKRRAMVSTVPGTTRDYLTASVTWSSVRVELVDTAGLRDGGQDELESMGQELAREQISDADLVLWLHDGLEPPCPVSLDREHSPPILEVWNKADGHPNPGGPEGPPGPWISAMTGRGLAALKEEILKMAGVSEDGVPEIVPNLRQQIALEQSYACLLQAEGSLLAGEVPEIAGMILRDSLDHLGAITGRVFTDELLEEVFRHFCLGK
ncbi:MAG: tRNA uridine-5-carboxymethylaminomethyl(34) synthesis GTPase MnmE [Deltaproteobacteria bacterium]|jgi:tRNA modification GTPase|nr:tRNA uridine-5-carboxymethylaminomethyl(34) synthesis GTPase MnmE [Deltaproteobacteria bacterium]